ncbi:nitrous oxide reductase accessory protein NosL [bacterium]|nr:nitrous oxide reductase accessory protein NosL [bacterium]
MNRNGLRVIVVLLVLLFCESLISPDLMALKLGQKKTGSGEGPYIPITPKERCPVCGMFVSPYPKWITQIQFKDGHHHSFDGMKCFCRFYFDAQKFDDRHKRSDFTKLLVRDYYTLKFIEHDKAYYVIGSDVLGPMGHELIPFESEERARIFLIDHRGQKIIRFSEVTSGLLDKLDHAKKTLVLDD